MPDHRPHITVTELAGDLQRLYAERTLAGLHGLERQRSYMADLRQDIEACEHALVGAAVTEIACLRADLSGPLEG